MKVLSVVGNRPQFIKSAPLSLSLREAGIHEVVLHTEQHYDPELSQVFFDELGLSEPDHRLGLQTADPETMRPRIHEVVRSAGPDAVLVYGDTNSTLAGAQAAAGAEVPVAHVEAGLRSGDLTMPEERNRIEVDRISALLYAPDERSRDILEDEDVHGIVEVVGDVMADASLRFAPIARERSDALERFDVEPGRFVLVTLHREANVRPERLRRIVEGLNRLDEAIVFPAHPRARAAMSGLRHRFELTEPLGYLDVAALASQARVIVTDSGGLQEEACCLRVPCVTLRDNTERPESVEVGANRLAGAEAARIVECALSMSARPRDWRNPFGDGKSGLRIVDLLTGGS